MYTNYSLFLRYELDENLTNIAEKQHAEILSELRRVLFVNSVNFITARGVANMQPVGHRPVSNEKNMGSASHQIAETEESDL